MKMLEWLIGTKVCLSNWTD